MDEGFWIYKNGRRIFIRGKRYTAGESKLNKPKSQLYDKRLKQIVKDEKPYYERKLRLAKSEDKSETQIKALEKRNNDLATEYLKLFKKKKLYEIKHKTK